MNENEKNGQESPDQEPNAVNEARDPNRQYDFGRAIEAAKLGSRIARVGWNGKGMFVFERPADELDYSFIEKVKSLPQSVKDFLRNKALSSEGSLTDLPKVKFGAYLCMYAADGSIVNGWLASQTDILAEDWLILD